MALNSFEELLDRITPEMHEGLRRAIELGKLPDGRVLDAEQKADMLRTLIAWEARHLPEHQRSGYLPTKNCSDARKEPAVKPGAVGYFDPSRH